MAHLRAEPGRVNLVVALRPEADPLIDHLTLRGDNSATAFQSWGDDEGLLRLVVCGVGKIAAAAATAELATRSPGAAWLNVGIGGHRDAPVGTAVLAHRITDAGTGQRWFPRALFDHGIRGAGVTTVDRACTDYPDDEVYDMEAAGFCATAIRHVGSELVHSVKIVSDGPDQPATNVTPEYVGELMSANLREISGIVDHLRGISAQHRSLTAPPPGIEDVTARFHFSVTQRRQLTTLLRRWQALYVDDVVAWADSVDPPDARSLIEQLVAHLDAHELRLQRR